MSDIEGLAVTLDTRTLNATSEGKFKVLATDGFYIAADASEGLFSVPNHEPVITITGPTVGTADESMVFEASAYDLETPIRETELQWTVDGTRSLGSGGAIILKASDFSEGNHEIVVTARDAQGMTGESRFMFRTRSSEPPSRRRSVRSW